MSNQVVVRLFVLQSLLFILVEKLNPEAVELKAPNVKAKKLQKRFLMILFKLHNNNNNNLNKLLLNVHLVTPLRSLLEPHLLQQADVNPSQMSSFPQPELDSRSLLDEMLAGFLLLHLNLELDVNVKAQLALVVLLLIDLQGIRVLLPHRLLQQVVANPFQMSSFPQPELDSKSLLDAMLVATHSLQLQLDVNAVKAQLELDSINLPWIQVLNVPFLKTQLVVHPLVNHPMLELSKM